MARLCFPIVLLFLMSVAINTGCNSADPVAVVDVPALVQELGELHTSVSEAMTADAVDNLDDAHDMLHRISYILAKLKNLEAAPNLDATTCAEIAQTSEQLISAYNEVDAAIHSGDTPDYAAVADEIASGVAKLQTLVP